MSVSEFRKDLVSGEWVLIAPGRSKRPHAANGGHGPRDFQDKASCPFEDPQSAGNPEPVLAYLNGSSVADLSGGWTTQVIPNKYPAVVHGVCGDPQRVGPFLTHPAHGFHEVVITKDHERSFAQFTDEETAEVLHVLRDRYQAIAKDDCGDYISMFHNWGKTAGGSVTHNHLQIISTPVIPPEVLGSVRGADSYFQQNGKPVHAELINWEVTEGKRILFENELFIAFCPYVSKTPYEVRIFPKKQSPFFQNVSDAGLASCAQTLNKVMVAIHDILEDPDLNFYIHTAPVLKDPLVNYDYYHWHLEIVPRVSVAAGFELGTAVYINVVDPDEAAAELRNAIAQ